MVNARPSSIDMSPVGVNSRLEDLRQLYRLMLSLRTIRLLGPLREHATPPPGTPVTGRADADDT